MIDGMNGVLSLDQALKIIELENLNALRLGVSRIGYELHEIRDQIDSYYADDPVDLRAIASKLETIDKTLFDTLGSAETGDALRAITDIAEHIADT